MLTVVARYKTRPGAGDEVAAVLSRHVAATRREPGCLGFTVLRALEDRERFVLYERYEDEEAFRAHRSSPHFAELVENTIVPLLSEREFARYEELPAAD